MARNVSQLKNEARRAEQREDWARAIELYREAIRASEEAGHVSPDLSLYNRIGDLFRRRGQTGKAVENYLKAVEKYAEQGLHTGAVALCNKILRIAPDRFEVHRQLGRLHAATGLMAEARNSFREYVSRMEERGDPEARLDALAELARLTDDEGLLFEVVEEREDRGETDRAVTELRSLWESRAEAGREVEAIRERILEIDPEHEFPGEEPAEADEEEVRAAGPAAPAADEGGRAGRPARGSGGDGNVFDPFPSVSASGGERAGPSGRRSRPVEAGGSPSPEDGSERAPDLDEVILELDAAEQETRRGGETRQSRERPERADTRDLRFRRNLRESPGRDEEPREPGEAADRAAAPVSPDPGKARARGADADLRDARERREEDVEVALRYAELLRRSGQEEEAAEKLEEILSRLEAESELARAGEVADRLLELDPDRVSWLRKRAELAEEVGDERRAVEAYLALAHAAEGSDDDEARRAYARILELEPTHAGAREALADGAETSSREGEASRELAASDGVARREEREAAEELRPDGYVDLGEAVRRRLAEAGAVAGPEEEPAGHDFDGMLVGFRAKVSETSGEADPAAHVELGVALRQMGLLEDAIREFQAAARAPEPPLRAFELLGEAFIEKGLHSVAVRVLSRALRLPGHGESDRLGVLYQLGIAHEEVGDAGQARECFERVYSVDIDFRDVAERLRSLVL